jgi:hypothetical protein
MKDGSAIVTVRCRASGWIRANSATRHWHQPTLLNPTTLENQWWRLVVDFADAARSQYPHLMSPCGLRLVLSVVVLTWTTGDVCL